MGLMPLTRGDGGWKVGRRRGGRGLLGEFFGGRGGETGGGDDEEFPRLDIKCCQYLSSRAKCAHLFRAPVLSTPGMMRRRL